VDVDGSDNVYVADTWNHRIQKLNSDGVVQLQLGTTGVPGSAPGEFNQPGDVAVDDAGNIYVVDRGNIRIQMFSFDGVFLSEWGGSHGTGPNQFESTPGSIAVDALGNNVYVGAGHRIYKFDVTGAGILGFVDTWGEWSGPWPGGRDYFTPNPLGTLDCSCDLAVDLSGNVYVAEAGNKRIQIFSPAGVPLGSISQFGYGLNDSDFRNPSFVALDDAENIYVTDTVNNVIKKFNSIGEFKELIYPYTNPQGLAIDSGNTLYVATGYRHTVAVYSGIEDADSDGIADELDNCINTANPDQADIDGDLAGDLCDEDDDNDTVPDVTVNGGQTNTDGDSMGDACDLDDDNDGVDDGIDQCPLVSGLGSSFPGDGCPDDINGLITTLHGAIEGGPGSMRASLGSKLAAAKDARHPTVARHQLNAFIKQVSAQSGKKISSEDAARLITAAKNLISVL